MAERPRIYPPAVRNEAANYIEETSRWEIDLGLGISLFSVIIAQARPLFLFPATTGYILFKYGEYREHLAQKVRSGEKPIPNRVLRRIAQDTGN